MCREQKSNAQTSLILDVPEVQRLSESTQWFEYVGLDDLFSTAVGDFFAKPECRNRLRMAGRRDLASKNFDDSSSVQGKWRDGAYENLDQVLSEVGLTGKEFLSTLGGLRMESCSPAANHWMDIVGVRDRKLPHSWHQDAHGRSTQLTVMLGFPAPDVDAELGSAGVFSHVVRLSHELLVSGEGVEEGGPVDFVDLNITESHIIRPRWKRGQEVLVYSDATTVHSAPDLAHRTSIWRIM